MRRRSASRGQDAIPPRGEPLGFLARITLNRYKYRTGRDAVIYTATSWWKQCTGNYGGFGSTNPLWIARYSSTPGELPAGWAYRTMWQYTSSGPIVGDHNKFNGALDRVIALANG